MIRFLQTKTKTKKIFLGLILGIVILSMVAFLGSFLNTSGPSGQNVAGVYATVGREQVLSSEVVDAARRQAQQMSRGQAVPENFLRFFYQRAADNLIVNAAVKDEAKRMGLNVSDQELSEELHKGEFGRAIFPGGNFIGQERYSQFVLGNFNMSVEKFEKAFKESLLFRKLINIVQASTTVSPSEVEEAYKKENVKVKFDYAVLTPADLMKQVKLNDAELHAYYDANKASLANSIPEQRRARYVVVDASRAPVTITEEDYKRAYDTLAANFKTPEQVDVRHILVKTKEQALDIKKQLEAGAKFDVLAKMFSEDPGSKDNGGLYKDVERNKMVPEFDKVAFSLEKGKISDPVQTSFGYHIIRVDEHRPARNKTLEEVKPELEKQLRSQKAAATVDTLATQIQSEAKTDGLEKAAAKHNLKVINTDYFASTATLPGATPDFSQQLFQLQVKAPPEKLPLGENAAVVEIVDVKPAATPTFEQAKSKIEEQLKSERASRMLADKTRELAERAHSLNNLKQAAKELGATVKTSELVGPSAQVPDLGAMSNVGVAFELKPGQISGPINAGQNGVVLTLLQREEPTTADFEKQKDQIRDRLLQQKRGEVMQLFAQNLRERRQKDGTIQINAQEAKRLLGESAGI